MSAPSSITENMSQKLRSAWRIEQLDMFAPANFAFFTFARSSL